MITAMARLSIRWQSPRRWTKAAYRESTLGLR